MTGEAPVNGVNLAGDPVLVRTGARADPIASDPAEKSGGEGSGDRGIADPHFAEDQDMSLSVHGGSALVQGIKAFILVHRGG